MFAGSGDQLGEARRPLHNAMVAPQGRIILTAEDLEQVFEVDVWSGPAMLEIEASDDFEVLTALTSPSGLVSNTNCVREAAVHQIESTDSDNVSYIRLINIGDTTIRSIRGSLVDQQGRPVGQSHAMLLASLLPKSQVWLTRDELQELIGASWSGDASLLLTAPHPNLRLLNLNFTSADTFFNFSCFEDESRATLFLVTNSASANQSEIHLINTSSSSSSFSGQLHEGSGDSTEQQIIAGNIEPAERVVISAQQLESVFNVDTWQGPAMVQLAGPESFEAIIQLTSPSGLVSNTNCVRQDAVHMLQGEDDSFVRFINSGGGTVTNVTGTLYDAAGFALGAENVVLIESLAAREQKFLNASDLSAMFDVNWIGEASLVVSADDDDQLQLLNLNLVNGSTFFNFSCYENSSSKDAVDSESYFETYLADSVVEGNCVACHTSEGEAGDSGLVFSDDRFEELSDYLVANGDSLLATIQDSNHAETRLSEKSHSNLVGQLRLLDVDVSAELAGGLIPVTATPGVSAPLSANAGHPAFMSPHVKPIVGANGFIYAANTPADTIDVIDPWSRSVVQRINVGVDPVGLAVRPDKAELWVANHISDTVSVVDTDASSPTYHQVIETVQALVSDPLVTDFDEPTGIAFASSGKAFVSLGPGNEIAVVENYEVTDRLAVRAQDPRAIVVRDDRLYVVPFESNNQTQLSGCAFGNIGGAVCTFNAIEHVFNNNNVLSTNYDADIIRNEGLPDRDLFVFDTSSHEEIEVIDGVGTLLYGLAVDSSHRVFVTQADARNDANGRAGTLKHGLAEMENRAFLNQLTIIDCGQNCAVPQRIDLEPLPPSHPEPANALATPYAVSLSADDSILYFTAAGSNKFVSMDPETGDILDRIDVGAVPRGIALTDDNEAFVLNVVDNTVSVLDVSNPSSMATRRTISLDDPTDPDIKAGRRLFNDAMMSTTGTFTCESCHPDGHTDQLIWVLDTPRCDVSGCTQIPPRLTMPVRGARDTGPYHWDGIPGDAFGGINTASINADVEPNCLENDPEGCIRVLVDGSLATTMCEVGNCDVNDEGLPGAFDAADRDLLSKFVLSVPYPPAPSRSFSNELSESAQAGFFNFSFVNNAGGMSTGAQTCGDCHKMPFLVSTNTPGTGMDAPTWRGAYDRWMILPQGRLNIIDLLNLVGMNNTFPERDIWQLAGSTVDNWQMVLEGSTGYAGAYARQVTLNQSTVNDATAMLLMTTLEQAASDEAVLLQGEGLWTDAGDAIGLDYRDGAYWDRTLQQAYDRSQLLNAVADGDLIFTLTGRVGLGVSYSDPQPAIWPQAHISAQTRNVELAFLSDANILRFNARHVQADASIFVDGRRVEGTVSCVNGAIPNCTDELVEVSLGSAPATGGLHFLQIKNAQGLFSNDMMFFSEFQPLAPRTGNLIASGGTFNDGFDDHWNTVELVTDSIEVLAGKVHINIRETSRDPWRAQLSHSVMINAGQEYTICYQARAHGRRSMAAYVDTNLDEYRNLSGGRFRVDLTPANQDFSHTFVAAETDLRARVAFDLAQSTHNVQIDNIGLYEGSGCGTP